MKANFVRVRPQGFYIHDEFYKSLKIKILSHTQARKKWDLVNGKKTLACVSWNGRNASHGRQCLYCGNIEKCKLKHRIFFSRGQVMFCIELPDTSYDNFRAYLEELKKKDLGFKDVTTLVETINRGYWGEILFSLSNSVKTLP